MKVKCITSDIEPEFIVGEIYKVRRNKIHGNGRRVYGPWLLSEGLKIMAGNNKVIASFEELKGKAIQ